MLGYEGESNENPKYFLSHNLLNKKRYTMTSFFYVVSIVFHTSVLALWKCMHTSRKKFFGWECSHLCTACCTSSLDLKNLPPSASLSSPKTWKSLGARSGEYGGCGRHSKDTSWIVATVEHAVWGQASSCSSKTPVLRHPRRLDLILGCRWFFRRLHMLHWSQCTPWACSAPKLPLIHPKA